MARRALIVVFALLSGCLTAVGMHKKASEDLTKSAKLFNDYVRWSNADKASEFVDKDTRAKFVDWRIDLDKALEITDVRVGATDFGKESQDATVIVTWTFFRKNEGTEQTKVGTEHWYRKDQKWFVKNEPDEMPSKL